MFLRPRVLAASLLFLLALSSSAGAGRILYYQPVPPEGAALAVTRPPIGINLLLEGERLEEARLEVDGSACTLRWEKDFLYCLPPEPLPPGNHTYTLTLLFAGPWRPLAFSRTFLVLPGTPDPPSLPGAGEEEAREEVNRLRGLADLPPLELHPALGQAARSHAAYCLRHKCWEKGLEAHRETPGKEGFSGETPGERAQTWGYPGYLVAENMHFLPVPARAVGDWMDSVYHRLALTEPLAEEMGYGQAESRDGLFHVNVLKVGSRHPFQPPPLPARGWNFSSLTVYPARGQREVPLSWEGREIPNPYRFFSYYHPPDGYPYPLTVQLAEREARSLSLVSASLEEEGGERIPLWALVPTSSGEPGLRMRNEDLEMIRDEHLERALALLPRSPLRPCTSYRVRAEVEIAYPQRKELQRLSWWFTTQGCPPLPEGRAWVSLEGERLPVPAVIREGRSFLPARVLLEALGFRVEWDPHRRTVTATREDGTRLAFKIGFDLAFRGEEEIHLDHPPFIYQDRTYLPVRALASLLGLRVEWREEEREVAIGR